MASPDILLRMSFEIPESEYQAIEALIGSEASPVGIDAKKTHVLILYKLQQIERRLARLEAARAEAGDS